MLCFFATILAVKNQRMTLLGIALSINLLSLMNQSHLGTCGVDVITIGGLLSGAVSNSTSTHFGLLGIVRGNSANCTFLKTSSSGSLDLEYFVIWNQESIISLPRKRKRDNESRFLGDRLPLVVVQFSMKNWQRIEYTLVQQLFFSHMMM